MFEQFGNYPEIKWMATTTTQFFGRGDNFLINPNLENFKLVRFKDLRKQPIKKNQLMLIGSSRAYVFIDGPDSRLDEIIKRLSHYKDKSWLEIKNMSLEKDFISCRNAYTEICDPRAIEDTKLKTVKPGEAPELELIRVDEICAKCEHFEPN